MANQHEDLLFVLDLQLFGDESGADDAIPSDDHDPFDDLTFGDDDDDLDLGGDDDNYDDPDKTKGDDSSKDTPTGDEFDEIIYNQKPVKIPVSERQTYLQKGYHFDKVKAEGDTAKQRVQELERELQSFREQQQTQQSQDEVRQHFNQRFQAHYQEFVKQGYDEAQAEILATSKTDQEYYRWEREQERQQVQEQQKRVADESQRQHRIQEGTRQILNQYDDLKKSFGDMLPEITGNTSEEKLFSLMGQLDEETKQDMLNNIPLVKAFKANHYEAIMKRQQELTEQRTVANISDRAKKSTETNKTNIDNAPESKLSSRQKALAKIFGVPAAEVAKRI